MKFYNYLNEMQEDEKYSKLSGKVIDYIKNNCQKYIKEWIRNNKLLWSGRTKNIPYYDVKKIRKNRKPKDTSIFIHNLLDEYFKKEFGVKLRSNSLFCYADLIDVFKYGNPYLICPIGEYETYWNPNVVDLYIQSKTLILGDYGMLYKDDGTYVNLSVGDVNDNMDPEIREKIFPEVKKNIEKLVKNYKKGVLKGTFFKGRSPEIMVTGDKYFIINHDLLKYNNFYLLDEIEKL